MTGPLPQIHIVVAMTRNRVIGNNGQLPWSIPQDLALFRQLTLGNTVLMGRTTYQSIGHPLPDRHNIVISNSLAKTDKIDLCSTFSAGIELAQSFFKQIFCIGGSQIYRQALTIADILHISWIEGEYSGDRYFPEFNLCDWIETDRQEYPGFVHCTYVRKTKNAP